MKNIDSLDIIKKNLRVNMVREDLENIPQYSLPPKTFVRWYRPGDDELWVKIHLAADKFNPISPEIFQREFGSGLETLPERQCYLIDHHGEAFGTATAWFDDDYHGKPFGRLHWIAIVPQMQGRGLAKPLTSIVCDRMRDLGHKRVCLTTSTARLPAINLYRKFGFVPDIHTEEDLSIWRQLKSLLKEPLGLTGVAGD